MDTTSHLNNFSVLFPGLSPFVSEYSRALQKAHKLKLRLQFLSRCLSEQVLPRSILPLRLINLSDRPFDDFQRIILQKQIDILKSVVEEAFKIVRNKKYSFDRVVPGHWKKPLLDDIYAKIRSIHRELGRILNRKLQVLIENSAWSQNSNPDFVVNLSDKVLDTDTTCALGYGLSFACSNKEVNCVEVAKAFCDLEKHSDIPSDDLNICKGIVYGAMSTPSVPNCPQRFIKAFRNLKKDNDVHVTKADKSNAIVILNKSDYVEKMHSLLSDDNTYKKLQRNPLETVNSQFNKKIKELLKGNDQLIKMFSSRSPTLPYMYGVIKTHKPNNPARPIVSSVGSVSYKLSKWIVSLLKSLVGTISDSHIKNSVDLVNKLNAVDMQCDFKLVSFDVTSLFTNVPVDDLLVFLSEVLSNIDLPVSNFTFLELIKLCIKECKFEFNGEYYSQQFGMSMGGCLSPILSNLYMEFFETKILTDILPSNARWFRYVDDVLCLWPCNENLDNFLLQLNDLVPSIKFTVEVENDCTLPFLDCKIHRENKKFKFSIFRKPTNICSYVHYYSAHHVKIKQSVFTSMFLRALRICDPEFIDDEFDTIYNIGSNLKYPKSFIDKSLKIAKKAFYRVEPKQQDSKKNMLILPYDERFTNVSSILNKFQIDVVFRNSCTVKDIIIKNSPTNITGCIYQIPCKLCNKMYVGESGKGLETRIKQHKYSIRTGQQSNALFIHVSEENHPVDWANAKIIVKCRNRDERNIIESSFIKYNEDKLINISSGMYKLDNFIIEKIVKSFDNIT